MLPLSYFTPVHKARRTGGQNEKTKRKRDDIDVDINNSSDNPPTGGQQTSSRRRFQSEGSSLAVASIVPVPHEQSSGDETSEPTFGALGGSSHQSAGWKRSISRKVLNERLGELQPPLLVPQQYPGQDTPGTGTRQHHLVVLTAIMHRCLLQHDYIRAGRAWSMILRSEMNGHSVDLRNGCRWGLGAEILLRQPGQLSQLSSQSNSAVEAKPSEIEKFDQYISPDRFEKIKQYYERLSLQYPYQKSFPNMTGPLDFRFATFSLWMYASTNQKTLDMDIHRFASAYATRSKTEQELALRRAHEIAERLDELLSSPPYSDSDRFRNLKAMVDLWTADLAMTNLGEGPNAANVGIEGSKRRESTTNASSIMKTPLAQPHLEQPETNINSGAGVHHSVD